MVKIKSGFDKKPQFFRMRILESAANTYTEDSFPSPNLIEAGFVMEILRLYWEIEALISMAAADGVEYTVHEGARAAMPHLNDSGVIWRERWLAPGAAADAFLMTGSRDFTDGAGNGLLMGRKELFIGIEGVSQTAAMDLNVAILYRLVKVNPAEIVGLLNS